MTELLELAEPSLYTELGCGTLPITDILDALEANGGGSVFVEQDQSLLPELESIAVSGKYLSELLSNKGG